MALMVPANNPLQHRTIKPLYAKTQATNQSMTLDPTFTAASGDILPGCVMSYLGNGVVTLCDGTKAPYGLADSFCAPGMNIDEVRENGLNLMGVWVGGEDSQFAIYPPAYDTAAGWTAEIANLKAGKNVYLKSNAKGLLTLEDTPDTKTANTICELLGMEGSTLIVTFAR